jgi:hypothetical protein
VHGTLALVLFGVMAVAVLLALGLVAISPRSGGSVYDEIGRGGLLGDEDSWRPTDGAPEGPPQDAGIPSGGTRPALADEVRQLAIARNERRARQGLEPLDVEAEVDRTLAELGW